MNSVCNDVPLATNTIKGLDPVEQAAILRKLVPRYLPRAAAIRNALETYSNGIVKVSIGETDEELVLLALLTAVADDIGTVPDARRRSALLAIHESVGEELGCKKADVQFFIRNLLSVMKALEG